MSMSRKAVLMAWAAAALLAAGCRMPGAPKAGPEVPRPEEVMSFDQLYGENCAGCHGANGRGGPAVALNNAAYQAWVDDASLREVMARGEKGTLMPAFSRSQGGTLSDGQIEAILYGMRSRWRTGKAEEAMPPYKADHAGDAGKGQAVYAAACARCHGSDAQHVGSAGSILDGAFLALINEQTLRTIVIAGRPDIGQPDWRGEIPGRAMTGDEVADVTAWLMAQRPENPGQPYPQARKLSELPGEAQPQATKRDVK